MFTNSLWFEKYVIQYDIQWNSTIIAVNGSDMYVLWIMIWWRWCCCCCWLYDDDDDGDDDKYDDAIAIAKADLKLAAHSTYLEWGNSMGAALNMDWGVAGCMGCMAAAAVSGCRKLRRCSMRSWCCVRQRDNRSGRLSMCSYWGWHWKCYRLSLMCLSGSYLLEDSAFYPLDLLDAPRWHPDG